MTVRERIKGSKDYLEGIEFTTARANTQLSSIAKSSISRELRAMASDGELVQRIGRKGSVNIAYYRKPGLDMRHKTWISEPSPTEYTPRYC